MALSIDQKELSVAVINPAAGIAGPAGRWGKARLFRPAPLLYNGANLRSRKCLAGGSVMSSERVVVSAEEVSQLKPVADTPAGQSFEALKSPVPLWARIGMSVLVLFLPVLAVITFVLRIAFRNQPRHVRFAWVSFTSTLLIISGLLTTVAAMATFAFVPVEAIVNSGLPDLDERHEFVTLPSKSVLTSADASEELKPLVVVVSPAAHLWNHQEVASNEFGAGALLFADSSGYLFATANHVVTGEGLGSRKFPKDAMIATASGVWSTAQVIATAPDLDLALLWVARHSGKGDFLQPVAPDRDGEGIFVIGHPEGLKFTLSTGIISGLRNQTVQVSAAISPGNSGGPVYDDRGNLVGIVSAKFDHSIDPNAENIGFATRADALLNPSGWTFSADGKQMFDRYAAAAHAPQAATPPPSTSDPKN